MALDISSDGQFHYVCYDNQLEMVVGEINVTETEVIVRFCRGDYWCTAAALIRKEREDEQSLIERAKACFIDAYKVRLKAALDSL